MKPEQASPQRYYTMLRQHQETQLFFAALRLDLFSRLDHWRAADQLAAEAGYPEHLLRYVLQALFACGLIEEDGERYRNTPEGREFLSRASSHFIGETLLFRERMTSLAHMDELMKDAGQPSGMPYDFAGLAEAVVPEMYAMGRVSSFQKEMKALFPNGDLQAHILDLGGGSGVLAIEFVKQYPCSSAVVFEHPSVAPVSRKIIGQHGVPGKVSVMEGDFNRDDLGGPYDLVIASGVLDFATENLPDFMVRIGQALKPDGYLLLIGQYAVGQAGVNPNMAAWLSGYLNGLPPAPSRTMVEKALQDASFVFVREMAAGQFAGQLFMKREG